ncbi:anosmin-1-like [Tubulanus polymorphus]|uniref:anosmin-1-like n=1 Tax=Tubulanus polymorphus TaxID=672921 RepID=UPI003DA2A079
MKTHFGLMVFSSVVMIVLLFRRSTVDATAAGNTGNSLIAAQCRAKCLHQTIRHKTERGRSRNRQKISLQKCLKNERCSACELPCAESTSNYEYCTSSCKDNINLPEHHQQLCLNTCKFLKQITTYKPGTCPLPSEASGFEAACVKSCSKDGDCEGNRKCCDNGCGYTCQNPLALDRLGLPPVPNFPKIRERKKEQNMVELFWETHTNSTEPTIYVVEARWHAGRDFSNGLLIDWAPFSLTTKPSIISQIEPGKWFIFRVAAISMNGSLGFSPESPPFRLSLEPRVPGQPMNLTEGETTIHDGLIDKQIRWSPPAYSDIPVTRFKIFWSKRLRGVSPMLVYMEEHKQIIPADQFTYTLKDMEPDTTYFVQVQAVCHYGEERLKSERASIYIVTEPLITNNDKQQESPVHVDAAVMGLPTPPPLRNVTVDKPFYENGLLKATIHWVIPSGHKEKIHKFLIHWTPDVCIAMATLDGPLSKTISATTHDTQFMIYDLRFDCRYVVKVQPVSQEGAVGPTSHAIFNTPSCSDVKIKGINLPDCPTNAPNVPQMPGELQHSIIIKKKNISAEITWNKPQSDLPITAYRIIWGQRLTDPLGDPLFNSDFPVMDKNTALTKVIAKSKRNFVIENLKEGIVYLIQLQALSAAGSGQVGEVRFTTPRLSAHRTAGSSDVLKSGDGYVYNQHNSIQYSLDGPKAGASEHFNRRVTIVTVIVTTVTGLFITHCSASLSWRR